MMALKLTTLLFLITTFEIGFIDAIPSGYTYISSARAYYKFHAEEATWADAVSTCRSEGARLFHPDSAEELQQVWRTLAVGDARAYYSLFTGLSDLDKLGEYKTVDGRPISQVYNQWLQGEPHSGENNEYRCGRLTVSTHVLYVASCNVNTRFICKHEEEVTATDVTTVTSADAIPSGYTYISSARAYYKFHAEEATWADAVSTCRSEGARLFHPDSTDELQLVWRTLAVGDARAYYSLFTGLSDLDKLGEYKTVDGRPLSQVYNKWLQGEPHSSENNEYRCGRLTVSTHVLYVASCNVNTRFICKHEEEVTATDVTTVTSAADASNTTMNKEVL